MKKKEHILLLGGTGFIGEHILQLLIERDTKISCLVHKRPIPSILMQYKDKIRIINGSITDLPWEILQSDPPDIIFHLARISGKRTIGRAIASRRSFKANLELIKWIKKINFKGKLIYISGSLSYGTNKELITEDTALNPTSFSKQYFHGEKPIYRALNDNKELSIIICKPCWVYGEGSWFESFFLKPMKSRHIVPLYGEGRNWMSLIHVQDCASMICWLAKKVSRGTYNLFIGKSIRQKDLAEMLSEISGFPIKKETNRNIRVKHGKAVKEAFNFSAKVGTLHNSLYQMYHPLYPNLKDGLEKILSNYD
ncbi:MAG: NAD-dependent epimerase/dehydratase family protein [Candidatus Thorarchaeota archaeon]